MLLAMWYDLSDVKLAEALDDRASFRRYCGFSGDEATPERTTFVRFRKALIAQDLDKALFDEIATQLKAKAIRVKTGTLVDATIIVSASRTFVTNQLTAWGVAPHDKAHGRVADITLVTSELAANATKFGSQDMEISLVAHGDHVQVAVTDNNPQAARLQQPGPATPGGPRPPPRRRFGRTMGAKPPSSTAKPSGRTSPCQPVQSSETAAPSPRLERRRPSTRPAIDRDQLLQISAPKAFRGRSRSGRDHEARWLPPRREMDPIAARASKGALAELSL